MARDAFLIGFKALGALSCSMEIDSVTNSADMTGTQLGRSVASGRFCRRLASVTERRAATGSDDGPSGA